MPSYFICLERNTLNRPAEDQTDLREAFNSSEKGLKWLGDHRIPNKVRTFIRLLILDLKDRNLQS